MCIRDRVQGVQLHTDIRQGNMGRIQSGGQAVCRIRCLAQRTLTIDEVVVTGTRHQTDIRHLDVYKRQVMRLSLKNRAL